MSAFGSSEPSYDEQRYDAGSYCCDICGSDHPSGWLGDEWLCGPCMNKLLKPEIESLAEALSTNPQFLADMGLR